MHIPKSLSALSEHQPHAKAEVPRIDQAAERKSCRDLAESVQIPDRAIGIQLQVRHVGSGVAEVRRIADVERFGAELQLYAFGHRECPEDAQIEVGVARTAQDVPGGRSEAGANRYGEGGRIEVGLPADTATYDRDVRLDQVGPLIGLVRGVESGVRGSDVERLAGSDGQPAKSNWRVFPGSVSSKPSLATAFPSLT